MENEYKIRVHERLSDGKYTPSFNARQDRVVPVGESYLDLTESSFVDLAKVIVENYTQKGSGEICLTAEGESHYTVHFGKGHFLRPPTADEMKQLGEEVRKALRGE